MHSVTFSMTTSRWKMVKTSFVYFDLTDGSAELGAQLRVSPIGVSSGTKVHSIMLRLNKSSGFDP
jgi:hypothetical protein